MLKNIVANLLGRFWGILSSFIFIPYYIDILGFESYSIISFTLIISGVLAILDAGLTATLSREFSRNDISRKEKVNTFISLESLYLIVVTTAIFIVICFSELIATKWLKLNSLSTSNVSFYLKIIGIDVGFQLLMRFYLGGFMGLDMQVKANLYQFFWALFRSGLVIVVLILYPSLNIFFIWQLAISIISTLIVGQLLKLQLLGKISFKITVNLDAVKKNWRFTTGMLLIALVASLNTQMDKLMISTLLPVNVLGYYTLAVSLAMGIVALISPISSSLLPKFTNLYSIKDFKNATSLFSSVNQVVSVLVITIMTNMIFFSNQLIWAWTGDLEISKNVSPFLPYMAFSFAMLALAMIPYNVAIANGYTKLNNILGVLSLCITLPGYWWGTKTYGPIGAALVFAFVQMTITLLYLYFIKVKFLEDLSNITIFFKHLVLPLILSFIVSYLLKLIPLNTSTSRVQTFLWFSICTVITTLFVGFISIGKTKLLFYISRLSINIK